MSVKSNLCEMPDTASQRQLWVSAINGFIGPVSARGTNSLICFERLSVVLGVEPFLGLITDFFSVA